jgi:hypothetical protein
MDDEGRSMSYATEIFIRFSALTPSHRFNFILATPDVPALRKITEVER